MCIHYTISIALSLAGVILGVLIGSGLVFALTTNTQHWRFALWVVSVCVFHLMEFLSTTYGHPEKANWNDFLFQHSRAFSLAMRVAVVEYCVESFLFPNLKPKLLFLSILGLIAVIFGQCLRSLAMYTLGVSFTHLVADRKEPEHVLGTRGVYAYSRHPSYLGWFWWAIGTQMLIANPICLLGYIYAATVFFVDRIPPEEESLLEFFGDQFAEYRAKVPIGFPLDLAIKYIAKYEIPTDSDLDSKAGASISNDQSTRARKKGQ